MAPTQLLPKQTLQKRFYTAVALLLAFVFATYIGVVATKLLLSLLLCLAVYEWLAISKSQDKNPIIFLFASAIILFQFPILYEASICLLAFIIGFYYVRNIHIPGKNLELFGFLYIAVAALLMVHLVVPCFTENLLWITIAIIIAVDTASFFTGKTIGGLKLAPKISPKKTWSGLIGGVCGGLVVGLVLFSTMNYSLDLMHISYILCIIFSAIMGDLIESWLKRKFDVKDSGKILPGHGGILDRFDSALLCSYFMALFYVFITSFWAEYATDFFRP